jgi:choline kinase
MKALILAAGRGSRLGSMTDDQPKGMTVLLGQSLLERQIKSISQAGITEIAAATGYQRHKITPLVGKQFINFDWASSNMVASLLCCEEYLCADTTIISYSDIVYSSDAVKRLSASEGDIVIAFDPNWQKQWELRFDNPLEDAETFELTPLGELMKIGGKATSIEEIKGQYIGLFKLSLLGFKKITDLLSSYSKEDIYQLDMTALFTLLLKQNIVINVVKISDFWFEIDNQKDLKICEQLILNH